jgi:hypothetical protein
MRACGLAGLCAMTGLGLAAVVAAPERLAALGQRLEHALSSS